MTEVRATTGVLRRGMAPLDGLKMSDLAMLCGRAWSWAQQSKGQRGDVGKGM